MSMQDIDVMRKYYSDEIWSQWQHYYERWPSPDWQALYRDIHAALDTDPAAPLAQALADRWLALSKEDAATPAIRTGLIKAWTDREHWPESLKRRLVEFDIERATKYIAEALWVRWDAEHDVRRRNGGPGVPRVTESRRALFHEWLAILYTSPNGDAAQALVAKSEALLDAETNGDEEIKVDVRSAFLRRHAWPAGMKRYIASLYDTDADTWSQVNDFIEQALAYTTSGGTRSHPGESSSLQSDESA